MGRKLTSEKKADQVWLAGLGALVIAEQEGSDLFQQLVKRGKEFKRAEEGGQYVQVSSLKTSRAAKAVRAARDQPYRVKARAASSIKEDPRSAGVGRRRRQSAPVDMQKVRERQARRLESARRAVLKEFGSLEKPGRDYERLKQERRIFTVTHRNATYVPSFQFDEKGQPHPAIAKVIKILGKDTSDWGLALWFTAANGWLEGKRPVDCLKDDPEEVVQAAEHEAAELVF